MRMNTGNQTASAVFTLSLLVIFLVATERRLFAAEQKAPAADSPIQTDSHWQADLLIVGGTESGCAAAVQAARMGVASIVLVNDIDWLGGQFSAEALGAIDENRGPSGYGHGVPFPRAGLFKEVIDRIEADNLKQYEQPRPGNTRVITTVRPAQAKRIFEELLSPYVSSGQIRIVSNHYPVAVTKDNRGKRVAAVRFRSTDSKTTDSKNRRTSPDLTVQAKLTIDASDWGDVIRLSGAGYEFGPDLKSKYHEPLAPTSRQDYPLTDMNPLTYCMVLVEDESGELLPPIKKPAHYDARNYRNHAYPKGSKFVYTTRRLVDHYEYPEIKSPDVILLCFPAFDYPLDVLPKRVADTLEKMEPGASRKNIVEMTREQRQVIYEDAKQYSLGFLYYMQSEVDQAEKDKRYSLRRFRLTEEFGTADRMPPKPYLRESLRLQAMYMMRQQDTTGHLGQATNFASAMYHDGVCCWQFEYDFHPTARHFITGDPAGPWTGVFRKGRTWGPPYSGLSLFPLRSLVPREIDGLLASQKNLGYSSLVGSAVRLHDQSMAIGQAGGAVAAISLRHNVQPRAIPFDRVLLSEVWTGLCTKHEKRGQPAMLWPFHDVEPTHPAFVAINMLAIRQGLPLSPNQTEFHPDKPAEPKWRAAVVARSLESKQYQTKPIVPAGKMTRGQFAIRWWDSIANLPEKPFPPRRKENDYDADGVADADDPLPINSAKSSWEGFGIPEDQDGKPPALSENQTEEIRINFTGKETPVVAGSVVSGFVNDSGSPFDLQKGFGWSRDISSHFRRRADLEGELRTTFLFTRSHDRWEHAVKNGRYRVTVCIGDAGHEQAGQNVRVENQPLFENISTQAGWFREKTIEVNVKDARLTVEIGKKGSTTNTCINWLILQPVSSK